MTLLGLGLGYNSWGWGGYGYPYGYGYGNPWGYGGWLNSGYYYNPYYSTPLTLGTTVIDYSQPLVATTTVQNPAIVTDDENDDPNSVAALADFEAARASFQLGDYNAALTQVESAIERLPHDTALHEFRGLVLFAQGNYREAAATIHAVLANGPGWDWETLRGLYPTVSVYTAHLRALEEYSRNNPDSADAQFLLGYHYMTGGYQDAGLKKFQRVVELQPRDMLAQRIVESSLPDSETTAAEQPAPETTTDREQPPALPSPPADGATATPAGPAVNVNQLHGDWAASKDDASFNISLRPDNTFAWKFAQGDRSSTLEGKYNVSGELLVLEPDSGPPMVARVSGVGADGFEFRMVGTPNDDPGLQFSKEG